MSISRFEAVPLPTLPPALAALPDKLQVYKPPADFGTVCGLHGPQPGASCDECDKFFPDAVEARKVAIPQLSGGPGFVSMADVQRMIQQAIQEERSFQAWKAQEAEKLKAEAEAVQAAEEAKLAAQTQPTP